MAVINVLSKQVAELIAAGEVIERPASVIKELVENSIDAGASAITVEIKNGGVTFMRVTDDGIGFERADVRNAFLRHATSKIAVSDDLDSIATLGFRGEALASICAVSRVELMTHHRDEEMGTLYRLEGGKETAFVETGCPQGTTFVVRDLFYNVPARMKFLKKDATESNTIASLMDRMALSHPEIAFTFIRDGKQVMKTSGKGDLATAIYQVFGKQFYESLLPVEYQYENITISGYISKPVSANRASRSMQLFFVNGRYVRTKTGIAALEQAYKGFIMVGKYPACILNLHMDCSTLDVNVHPAKLEIRFTNEKPVYESVYHGVRTTLSAYDTRNRPSVSLAETPHDPKVIGQTADKGQQMAFSAIDVSEEEPSVFTPTIPEYGIHRDVSDIATATLMQGAHIQPINLAEYRREDKALQEHTLRYIGEAFLTYIIVQYDSDRLMLIDKHAAHERLIYEKLKRLSHNTEPQILLEPISLVLDKSEYTAVIENIDLLAKAGFEAEDFGTGTVLLRGVPLMLEKLDVTETFMEIVRYLNRHRRILLSEKMEWIYANTACRSAIKAGDHNSPEELIALVKELESHPDVRYCPHGRPIYYFLSRSEIEKSFKRI